MPFVFMIMQKNLKDLYLSTNISANGISQKFHISIWKFWPIPIIANKYTFFCMIAKNKTICFTVTSLTAALMALSVSVISSGRAIAAVLLSLRSSSCPSRSNRAAPFAVISEPSWRASFKSAIWAHTSTKLLSKCCY